jgi:RES domain-containing protein
MSLWRIGLKEFPAFDGKGAFNRGGRWNSKGIAAVYCALNVSAARLEVLSHTPIGANHRYFTASSIEKLSLEKIGAQHLPKGWDGPDYSICNVIGDEWLKSGRTLLLQVPSVASPLDYVIVVNPNHPEFRKLKLSAGKKIAWPKSKK